MIRPRVQQQIDKRVAEGVEPVGAREQLLAEKQPSSEFVTPAKLGRTGATLVQ